MAQSSSSLYDTWRNSSRQQAFADGYRPLLRGVLIAGCIYFAFIAWRYISEYGVAVAWPMVVMSILSAIVYLFIRQSLATRETVSLLRLELYGVAVNLLMYANLVGFMLTREEHSRLVYFALMAVVFSATGVTLRSTLLFITLAVSTLVWFSFRLAPDLVEQYVYIGVSASLGAFALATQVRKVVFKQIDARLLADEMTAKAQLLARTDSLTGVPNRRAMFDLIDQLVAKRDPFWLGIFDLDGFKAINDVYGHIIGDRLLCAAVERANRLEYPGSVFGRIGGDEFIVILPGSMPSADVEKLGNRVIKQISLPYDIDLLHLTIGASAGMAHFPSMGNSTGQLYEKADYALFKAKSGRRGVTIVFDSTEDREMKETVALERALREGDLERELFLQFQPQYSPSEHRFVGFEALARWQSPSLGPVRPDKFIRSAERSGHIRKVTSILFSKGLEALRTWPEPLTLSFNLSAQDISDRSFMLSLLDMIHQNGISPKRVEFEITETAVMADVDTACALLAELRLAGCKIALDDFGSGYSSFEYLDALPLDKVKVDKSFVRKVAHNVTSREIVAGLIDLCRKLDLRCVLEGVETDDEMMILSPLQPDLIQGYLFGKPMGAIEARDAAARLEAAAGSVDEPVGARA
ncbi:EAL domain-containing protein [Peteryoungia desertarenae]|uniref:EAL domain-containing protein n=1 Tax=Peteryoungia desertarenae TaxID=1813451 RepID=A0ABX6QMX7_9HYPH|nr:EAL domain-containing protein [Peteryoungia desertarenae]QLF69822.1 EAL domain-containing protein [Peteryoungia desertarenae]